MGSSSGVRDGRRSYHALDRLRGEAYDAAVAEWLLGLVEGRFRRLTLLLKEVLLSSDVDSGRRPLIDGLQRQSRHLPAVPAEFALRELRYHFLLPLHEVLIVGVQTGRVVASLADVVGLSDQRQGSTGRIASLAGAFAVSFSRSRPAVRRRLRGLIQVSGRLALLLVELVRGS